MDGEKRGERMPRGDWHADTRSWWATWRRSPQTQAFLPTDWQRLRMLLPLIDAYNREPSVKLFAEIRLNEERLGATVVDRLRARMQVEMPPADDHAADLELIADARRRLRGAG